MLERMREFSKSWLMKGLLGLVGLSFVAYFGSTPFQKRRKERLFSAVKVNGQIVPTQEFFQVYNQLRDQLEGEQGWPLDEEQQREIAQEALDLLTDRTLQSQWSAQVGLRVTDDEVRQRVVHLWNQLGGGRPLTEQAYRAMLNYFDYQSVRAFEDEIRSALVQEKLGAVLTQRVKVSEPELREVYARLRRQAKVVAVGFLPEDYMEQVEPTREKLVQYYRRNEERYRVPERVRVDYIEIRPEQLQDEVVVDEQRLGEFFNRNRSQYQIEPKASVDYVLFAPGRFGDGMVPSEEEVQQYYEEHPDRYRMPERIKVRYIPMAVQDAAGVNAPSQSMLQAEYLSTPQQYEQVEASLILLRPPEEGTREEQAKVLEELQRIRQEIEEGRDFADAAREYSQDETAEEGGRLGFVGRGQLPRALNRSLFSLGVGQLSEPIKGIEGYYLLKVHNKHVAPLEEVRDDVARRVAASRLAEALRALRGKELPAEKSWRRLRVLNTDFFEQGEYINDLIGSDYYTFSDAAFRIKDGRTTGVIHGRRNLYLISRIETQPAQAKPLEEVRQEVVQDIQAERAPQAAQMKAEEALGWIQQEGLSFEEMAARVELEIQNSGYFGRTESPVQLGPNPYPFVWTAFNLKPNQVSEVVTLESGSYLLRGRAQQEARLPELAEVREQVELDYRRERSVALARDQAYEYLGRIEDQGFSLGDLAQSEQIEVHDSGLFSRDEPLPGLPDSSSVFQRAAFSILQVGQVLPDIVPVAAQPGGEVVAVYLLQLKDRAPSHIPRFAEVIQEVEENLQREMAAELAWQDGEAFVAELYAAYVPSASSPFDLRRFADQEGYESFETPFFSQLGYVPGIAGTEDSPQFTRTVFSLQPGQCSGLIPVKEELEPEGSSEGERRQRLTGYYVVQLVERMEPDFDNFDEQRQSLLNQLLRRRRPQSFRGWQEGLRARAEIVRNEAFLGDYEQGEPAADSANSEGETESGEATES